MSALVADGKMSEDVYKQLVETLGREKRKHQEEQLYELKYRQTIVSAQCILSHVNDDEQFYKCSLFETTNVFSAIVKGKKHPFTFTSIDDYNRIFRMNKIAVDEFGEPIMKPGDTWSDQIRGNKGNVVLIQNTVIEIKAFTNKRVRESDDESDD